MTNVVTGTVAEVGAVMAGIGNITRVASSIAAPVAVEGPVALEDDCSDFVPDRVPTDEELDALYVGCDEECSP